MRVCVLTSILLLALRCRQCVCVGVCADRLVKGESSAPRANKSTHFRLTGVDLRPPGTVSSEIRDLPTQSYKVRYVAQFAEITNIYYNVINVIIG